MIICRECENEIDEFVILTNGKTEWYYCLECYKIGLSQGLKEEN